MLPDAVQQPGRPPRPRHPAQRVAARPLSAGPLRIGGFTLGGLLGRGANAVVHAATHTGSGTPVALKVLHADAASTARVQAAFREEVRAVARLDHPGIVLVFEHGVVTADEARQSGGQFAEGAPWLAMERASRGTLEALQGDVSYKDVRGILSALLSALAHAHARGVLHRDVKPANVLLGSPDDLRHAVRLADFGLAWALEQEPASTRICGSPSYMAPEQLDGRWRVFGPATDLYAVGCVGWYLATGAPPFGHDALQAVAARHRFAELPSLTPRTGVPERFESFLVRMLAKDPADRFACAADAAHALRNLGEPASSIVLPRSTSRTPLDRTGGDTMDLGALLALESVPVPQATARAQAVQPLARTCPPVPETWRPALPPFEVPQLHGSGLSLWGLRAPPFTGRDAEADVIWDALRRAAVDRGVRTVLLRGAPGVGKSRVAQELVERAVEVGAAALLKATHGPTPGATDGIAGMLARRFAANGLDDEALHAHLSRELGRHGLGDADVSAVHALLRGRGAVLARTNERWNAVQRVLERLAEERPLVLWVDDAQWGPDAAGFAAHLQRNASFACLIVVTSHAQVDDASAAVALRALREGASQDSMLELSVEPLSEHAGTVLAQRLLGLSPGLARHVFGLTGGNPLFMYQLLGSWVSSGAVRPGPAGLELIGADVPSTLREAWEIRLRAALGGAPTGDGRVTAQPRPVPSGARGAIEVAAVLGESVLDAEWEAVVGILGRSGTREAREALFAARLALPETGGWAFAHGLLRTAILESTPDVARLHSAAADVLSARGAGLRRVAAQLRLAGRDADAASVLVRETARLSRAHAAGEAVQVLADVEELLPRLEDPAPIACEINRLRAEIEQLRGACDDAARHAEAALAAALALGDPGAETAARTTLGSCYRSVGRYADARAMLASALACARRARATQDEGWVQFNIGLVGTVSGQLDDGRVALEAARALGLRAGDERLVAESIGRLGDHWRQRGDQVAAARCFKESAALHRARGNTSAESVQLHGLAEAQRLSGLLEEAEAGYRRAIEMDLSLGKDASIPRLNLCLCLLARGTPAHAAQAEAVLRGLDEAWTRAGRTDLIAYAQAGVLCATAIQADGPGTDVALTELDRALATGSVDIDLAQQSGAAAVAWERHGDAVRAARCASVSAAQWAALGNEDERTAIARLMS